LFAGLLADLQPYFCAAHRSTTSKDLNLMRQLRRAVAARTWIIHLPIPLFGFLLQIWALLSRQPAFTRSQLKALTAGDEFAVIMYYAQEDAARKRGEKIAEKLAKTPMIFNGKRLILSTAYGYYTLQSGDDAESALASADTLMYLDKKRKKMAGGLSA